MQSDSSINTRSQPRSQAFPPCGGKTLVQAGHVTPRFWEITKIRGGGEGGEWYNMLIRPGAQ